MQDKSIPTEGNDEGGLECRKCGYRHFRVVSVRAAHSGRVVRRRECRHCGAGVATCASRGRPLRSADLPAFF